MLKGKIKIVLDADVVIHFIKAECFSLLFRIFPEYEYLLLDVVYDELSKNQKTKTMLDNYMTHFNRLKKEKFDPKGESMREYFSLR